MTTDTLDFLKALFTPCEQGFLTLTAIHPDGRHPTPSRHVRVNDPVCLARTLERLSAANEQGWGAYVAVATRKTNLGRWRRGGEDDLLALPALFVDVDDPALDTLERLQQASPTPSCITYTGGGFHAYWWLAAVLPDFTQARQMLHALATKLGGDQLSPTQSLRLPGTRNTKAGRNNTLCQVIVLRDARYTLADFSPLMAYRAVRRPVPPTASTARSVPTRDTLNPALLDAVTETLIRQGYRRSGDWLSGPCLFPKHHRHGDQHPSFGFNMRSGYANCYRCGSLLLKDLCQTLGICPADYGGLLA
ncbi:MAG TPA: DNA-primase RepB domain-containing protein [Aggregatilinea sp.]|uniref:DNA-primase RepB domain-containing protein n=1 Tax=Aggregatilinea sp. TaxID=2806333 RepID=UPI002C0A2811|nr:DNA-primase RepB domain-containing protein [Aggregatilinea sp.]HML20975.1 DNA-primase RepB domain-containing protein [Aggregatilinea sp.]